MYFVMLTQNPVMRHGVWLKNNNVHEEIFTKIHSYISRDVFIFPPYLMFVIRSLVRPHNAFSVVMFVSRD